MKIIKEVHKKNLATGKEADKKNIILSDEKKP